MKLKKIKRNDNGLISGSSVDYVYNEDGFVDWRKMVKTDHLVPNKQKTSETDVSKLALKSLPKSEATPMSDMKSLAHPQTMLLQLAALIGFQTMRQRIVP